jgi:hypothetical protein
MKTKKSFVVLAVITLVFALVFTTCSNGGGGGGNQGDQTGTQGQLAFERITSGENAGTWRVRKGTFKGGALVIPAYYNGSTGRAARGVEDGDPVAEIGSYDDSEGYGAFTAAGITSLEIPDTVRRIGGYAFMYNPTLIAIKIPASVTEIGVGTFTGCDNLKNITVAAGNPNYLSEDGILYTNIKEINGWYENDNLRVEYTYTDNNEKTVLHSYPSASGSVAIREGVTCIESCAFNQTYITSITIPLTVTLIKFQAFIYCTRLTSISVDSGNSNYSGEGGILYNKDKTVLEAYPSASGNVIIKEGVTVLGNALMSNYNITSVTIPSTVTSLADNEFANCTSLSSVTIPSNITSIGYYAFYNCTSLSSITIPSNVTSMGYSVFRDWTSSQTINIPFANQEAADTAWRPNDNNGIPTDENGNILIWRSDCNAKIVCQP